MFYGPLPVSLAQALGMARQERKFQTLARLPRPARPGGPACDHFPLFIQVPRPRGDGLLDHGRRVHERSRSEEHTSELQSLAYLVCRLLLEKKKTQYTP